MLRKEKITVPFGKFEAFVVKPIMDFESIFKQEGDVFVWVSTDQKHMPLMMESEAFAGIFTAVLTDAKGFK